MFENSQFESNDMENPEMKTVYTVRGKNFSIKTKIHPTIGISYHAWAEFPDDHKINDTHVGKQVWVAGEAKTSLWFLVAVHPEGAKMFPKGGFTLRKKGSKIHHNVDVDTAILHPDNFKRIKKPVRTKLLGSLPKPITNSKR